MTATPKGENTRQQILQAACRLFLERGYSATSMREIASAAGLTTGGVYAHFPCKEDIFSAVFHEMHPYRQVLPVILQAEGETLEALVQDAARRMVAELNERQELLKLLFIDMIEFHGRHFPSILETSLPEVLALADRFARFQGSIRPIPPQVLARTFIGLFFSFYITGMVFPERFSVQEEDLTHFTEIYLHGIQEQP